MPPTLDSPALAASIPWFNNSWLSVSVAAVPRVPNPNHRADRSPSSARTASTAARQTSAVSHRTRHSSSVHTTSSLSLMERGSLVSVSSSAGAPTEAFGELEGAMTPAVPTPPTAVALARQASNSDKAKAVQMRIVQVRHALDKVADSTPLGSH